MITDNLLSIILFAPFVGASLLFFVKPNDFRTIRGITILFGGIAFIGALILLYIFDYAQGGFQFIQRWVWLDDLGISFYIGVDGIGAPMVLASSVLMFAGIFVSWPITDRLREFYINLLVLGSATMGVYMSLDLFFLFFFYELSVIPMYLFIAIWGRHTKGYVDLADNPKRDSVRFIFNFNQSSKEYAAMKLTLYISAGAVVALLGILLLYAKTGTFDLLAISEQGALSLRTKEIAFLLIFLGFAPIAAIWPFHSWSPVGYAAAPAAASMMHAGVLKKLGHFSIIRIAFTLFPEATVKWMPVVAVVCIVNIFYGALVAFLQKDIKFVIGYSSVAHMGYIFLGMAALNRISLTGAVFFLFADAMAMGLLFALGGALHHKTHTLDIPSLGGLARKMPFIAACFVLGSAASFGLPGGMNFIAELLVFIGAFPIYPVQTILAAIAIVLTWAYYFRMIRGIFWGEIPSIPPLSDAKRFVERFPLILLAAFTLFFGIFPAQFIKVIQSGVMPIAQKMEASFKAVATATPPRGGTDKPATLWPVTLPASLSSPLPMAPESPSSLQRPSGGATSTPGPRLPLVAVGDITSVWLPPQRPTGDVYSHSPVGGRR